jgi:hypothetical protein
MNKNLLWMVIGCVAVGALVWALVPGSKDASWLLLLMPLVCVVGHCVPSLFFGKRACHKAENDSVMHDETKASLPKPGR